MNNPRGSCPEPAPPAAGAPSGRSGPRPILVHLALAAMRASVAAPPSPPPAGSIAATGYVQGFTDGILAYHAHPWRRADSEYTILWQHGCMRLLDFGGTPGAPPLLFVPSLINRGYVLDLAPENSLILSLVQAGFRPLLIDWGWPDAEMLKSTLGDYVTRGVEAALAALHRPVVLVGYCMGGLLALAAAQRTPASVSGLVLLATPWDFRSPNPARADALAAYGTALDPVFAAFGAMPIDALQILFALQDPDLIAQKYARFASLDPASPEAELFVAIEDWANDCIPLAAAVARECLIDWYGANTPARGLWRVGGTTIAPESLRIPSLVVVPARDRIVPPESALPLATLLPGAALLRPNSGHVGMIAGPRAKAELWQALAAWLTALQQPPS